MKVGMSRDLQFVADTHGGWWGVEHDIDEFRASMADLDSACDYADSLVSHDEPKAALGQAWPLFQRFIEDLCGMHLSTVHAHAESPIEKLLFSALAIQAARWEPLSVVFCARQSDPHRAGDFYYPGTLNQSIREPWRVCLQARLSEVVGERDIRVDCLCFVSRHSSIRPIVIECDGFDYHSDRDAFTRDRQRDRALLERGFEVRRFSGSEIHKDPFLCATTILQAMSAADRR